MRSAISSHFPVAVDVIEAELAQPSELRLHVEQAVRWILVLERLVDCREERQMQAMGGRRHMLEVGEDSTGFEQIEHLAVERALPLVLEMVDGKRRDDGVEAPERGQWLGEVMLDQLDALVLGEALACLPEHELGEVEAHAEHLLTIDLEKGEQAAVARAEVEDASSVARHVLK